MRRRREGEKPFLSHLTKLEDSSLEPVEERYTSLEIPAILKPVEFCVF